MSGDRSAQERFLIDFHAARPGVTPFLFADGRLADGRSSYRWLLDALPPDLRGQRVLDLACGDGHLSQALSERGAAVEGVDISPVDVQAATARRLPGARFRVARAQDLPLESGSVDHALCHLALMLFDDVEDAVAEVGRVVRPGGTFAAILGGEARDGDGWGLFLQRFREASAGDAGVSLGDGRTRSPAGIRRLLEAGFEGIEVVEATLDTSGPPEALWSRLSASYLGGLLSPTALEEVRGRWMQDVATIEDGGMVPAGLIFRRVIGRRRG